MKNKVSFDSQLTKFGIGLFETIRVEKTALDLDEHMDRMFKSIELLKLNIEYDKKFLKEAILNYIKENKIENKALRLTIFDEGYNISTRNIVYDEETYNRGYKLTISPIKRGASIIYRHKTTNYFESMYSKHYATDRNFDDAIFLDSLSNILECSMSNIFFIKSNTIYTPKSSSPILNGIMKSNVKSICKNLDINLVECDINISCIDEYDAVFVTNSLMGIMPVTNICDVNYDKNHDLIKKLQKNL